jgi:hypothetical protein
MQAVILGVLLTKGTIGLLPSAHRVAHNRYLIRNSGTVIHRSKNYVRLQDGIPPIGQIVNLTARLK